ncbi:MAG TPA: PA0069 family radical SAM protein [Candidatus Hydrogenedentes bacterium]|nr:PA0069 family radical SAM protein [Candidatus Hydrogenedentota bacterium]
MLDPTHAIRGRGATHNPKNRFDEVAYVRDADWDEEEAPRPGTQYLPDATKSILATNDSPDIPFEASLNPYRGCEHGCIYCYARPTHEFFGYSAGLDFETKIFVKHEAPELLRKELMAKRWQPKSISISGVTDPYQPIERKLAITRQCLQVLAEFRNPCGIVTKNRMVARDIDVLQNLARHNAALVFVSVTTLDVALNRVMEPRTSLPQQRLDTIRALSQAGIPVGVMIAPVVPGLTDEEIPSIAEAAADAGARFAGMIMLRLPFAVAPLFEAWLDEHYPGKKDRILNRVRSVRGGNLYKSAFGSRMRGEGFHADQISSLFKIACAKHGLNKTAIQLSTKSFIRPDHGQLSLFEAGE